MQHLLLVLDAFAHLAHPDRVHLLTHVERHAQAAPVKRGELELVKLREAPDTVTHHVIAHGLKGIHGYLTGALFRCSDHDLVMILTSD